MFLAAFKAEFRKHLFFQGLERLRIHVTRIPAHFLPNLGEPVPPITLSQLRNGDSERVLPLLLGRIPEVPISKWLCFCPALCIAVERIGRRMREATTSHFLIVDDVGSSLFLAFGSGHTSQRWLI